jgi:hypothetical protein
MRLFNDVFDSHGLVALTLFPEIEPPEIPYLAK